MMERGETCSKKGWDRRRRKEGREGGGGRAEEGEGNHGGPRGFWDRWDAETKTHKGQGRVGLGGRDAPTNLV